MIDNTTVSPFISIIIPAYNQEKHIEECINSVINQNCPKSDFEIICINDGSTDNTENVLKKYVSAENFRFINKENGGVSSARNTGIDFAKGKYLWFVDSDDFIAENVLDIIIDKLRCTDCDMLYLKSHTFNEELSDEDKKSEGKFFGNDFLIWPDIFKREIAEKNNIRFNENLSYNEDVLFNHQFRLVCNKTEKLDLLCYYYRQSLSSTMGNLSNSDGVKKHLKSNVLFCKSLAEEIIKSDNDLTETWDYIDKYVLYISMNLNCLNNKDFLSSIEKMKEMKYIPDCFGVMKDREILPTEKFFKKSRRENSRKNLIRNIKYRINSFKKILKK